MKKLVLPAFKVIPFIPFCIFLPTYFLSAQEETGASEDLFQVEEEVKTDVWKEELDKKIKESPIEPEEYVVSGSKYAQSLREAPATMTVLDQDDIRSYGITTIEELLRIVPGLGVKAATPSRTIMGIRGMYSIESNTVLVLVNGREENSNLFGGVLWDLFPIPIDDVKRIEVIRGPGSVLYGANAYSGVINIITRHPREERRLFFKPEFGVYQADPGVISGTAGASSTWRHFAASASANYRQVQRWMFPDEMKSQIYRIHSMASYELNGRSFFDLEGGYIGGESSSFTWIGEVDMSRVHICYFNALFSSGPFRVQGNFRETNGNIQINTPLLPEFILSQYFPRFPALMHNFEGKVEYTAFLGRRNRITGGSTYLFNRFHSDILINSPQWEHRFGFFAQDEFRPVEQLIVYLGARYDYNDTTEEQTIFGSKINGDLSPRVSIVYLYNPQHSFRASAGRAFRKPSFFESGLNLEAFQSLGIEFIYSPWVTNEHINSYEIAYHGQPHRRLELSATAFFNQYRDTLRFSDDVDFLYHNLDNYADSFGGEMQLGVILPRHVRGFANYAVLEVKENASAEGKEDPMFPTHTVNVGVRWLPPKGPTFSLLLHWMSKYQSLGINPETSRFPIIENINLGLGNSLLIHGKASYRILNNQVEAGVKVFNLLNNRNRQYAGISYADSGDDLQNFGGEQLVIMTALFIEVSL